MLKATAKNCKNLIILSNLPQKLWGPYFNMNCSRHKTGSILLHLLTYFFLYFVSRGNMWALYLPTSLPTSRLKNKMVVFWDLPEDHIKTTHFMTVYGYVWDKTQYSRVTFGCKKLVSNERTRVKYLHLSAYFLYFGIRELLLDVRWGSNANICWCITGL